MAAILEMLAAIPGASKEEYADVAFAAGTLFDVFVMLANTSEQKKKITNFIEAIHTQSFKTGTVAAQLSKAMPSYSTRWPHGSIGLHVPRAWHRSQASSSRPRQHWRRTAPHARL